MMGRLIFFLLAAFLFETIFSVCALWFELTSFPLTIIPLVAVYGAFFQEPFEAALSAVLVGLIVDILSGSPFGLNIFTQTLVWMLCSILAGWIGKPRWVIILGATPKNHTTIINSNR